MHIRITKRKVNGLKNACPVSDCIALLRALVVLLYTIFSTLNLILSLNCNYLERLQPQPGKSPALGLEAHPLGRPGRQHRAPSGNCVIAILINHIIKQPWAEHYLASCNMQWLMFMSAPALLINHIIKQPGAEHYLDSLTKYHRLKSTQTCNG